MRATPIPWPFFSACVFAEGFLWNPLNTTPWKIKMEAKNEGLVQMIFHFNWLIFRFQSLIFRDVFLCQILHPAKCFAGGSCANFQAETPQRYAAAW